MNTIFKPGDRVKMFWGVNVPHGTVLGYMTDRNVILETPNSDDPSMLTYAVRWDMGCVGAPRHGSVFPATGENDARTSFRWPCPAPLGFLDDYASAEIAVERMAWLEGYFWRAIKWPGTPHEHAAKRFRA